MVAIGGVIGIAAAVAVGRLASSLLFGLEATDPTVILLAVALLGVLKIAMGWPLQLAALAAMVWLLSRNSTPLTPAAEAE